MSHTPGPWYFAGKGIVSGNECCVAVTETYSAMQKLSPTQREANAKLMAAAPELVDAIIDLFNQLDDAGLHGFVLEQHGISFQKLNEVLEKATGGIV